MRVQLNEVSLAEWQEKDLEHLRYEYDLSPDDLVIDIGAYRGEWAAEIFKRYGCKLICIEPTPYMDFKECELINAAASDHDGQINVGGAYYYTSSHETPTHSYPCFDINPLLEKYGEIALVKMNIEGSEYELLRHIMGAGLHRRIKNFQVQFHLIEGKPTGVWYDAIAAHLGQSHSLTWSYSYCWENWKRNA